MRVMRHSPTIEDYDLIDAKEAMKRLGYKDPSSFRKARVGFGIPAYRYNGRKIMFDKRELAIWLRERREGL
jgi:hypothetical protein